MRAISALALIGIVAGLAACVALPPPPLNSPAFARRPPLPGQPGYLATIKYVDDGLRYIMPNAGFLISGTGEMCFQGSVIPGVTLELVPQHYWCMSPFEVSRVDALENDTTYVNEVRLWCRHASPQCAHKIAYPNQFDNATVADSITAATIPYKPERAAIEYLVYLMGGDAGHSEALRAGGGNAPDTLDTLDTGPRRASVRPPTLATEEPR